ncbi:pyrroline-5-carboxylate reductase [Aliikangiella maris]|uniref:Pyrroline-5-carboxylate reductase n=2 Tax=Aliikangiella maris TaxID=3162458 RepID=A0ABV2BZ02_9GAMM
MNTITEPSPLTITDISQGQKIAFIGCGNMAKAIINGLVASGWPAKQIIASNPSNDKLIPLANQLAIATTNNNLEAAGFADIIILAVKPQKLTQVCQQLAKVDLSKKLLISVAAGYKSEKIAEHLGQTPPIIRAMPNTPAFIQCGASGLFATSQVNEQHKNITVSIFEAVGKISWVSAESHMDVVTAIAGSSPAYIFLMMQAMIEQAVELGLEQQQAFTLVTQAVSGAAQLAQATPEKSLDTLRKEVTSPGGTTAAAITSLIGNQFESIVKQAVTASVKRGQELGNQ